MLPKEHRLKKSRDFDKVFKKSRPVFTRNLSFRVLTTYKSNENATRVGFVVSNKISKLASRRNAIKRQLRAIVLDLISQLKPGYDVIVILKSDFPYPYNQAEIKTQIEEGFKKAQIL